MRDLSEPLAGKNNYNGFERGRIFGALFGNGI
jgi:hypothetical protein